MSTLGCTRQAAYLPDGSAYTPASMETDAQRQARMRRHIDAMQADAATARFRTLTRAHSERRA